MGIGKVESEGGPKDAPRRKGGSRSGRPFATRAGHRRAAKAKSTSPPRSGPARRTGSTANLRPEHIRFAQNMVHAADVACTPGPTTDGDMLPRESVTGMFLRARVIEEGEALGRGPVERDDAARLVIEHHSKGKSGRYYDAVVEEDGPQRFRVRLHPLDPNPPFLPAETPEASYVVERATGRIQPAD